MNDEKSNLLPNHNRILSGTARKVETTLDEMEEILKGKNKPGNTVNIIPVYNEKKRNELLKLIEEIRAENEKMFTGLNLKPQKLYEDRIIKAQSSNLWTILIDSNSKHLKSYGNISENDSAEIDSYMEKLISLLEQFIKNENI